MEFKIDKEDKKWRLTSHWCNFTIPTLVELLLNKSLIHGAYGCGYCDEDPNIFDIINLNGDPLFPDSPLNSVVFRLTVVRKTRQRIEIVLSDISNETLAKRLKAEFAKNGFEDVTLGNVLLTPIIVTVTPVDENGDPQTKEEIKTEAP